MLAYSCSILSTYQVQLSCVSEDTSGGCTCAIKSTLLIVREKDCKDLTQSIDKTDAYMRNVGEIEKEIYINFF